MKRDHIEETHLAFERFQELWRSLQQPMRLLVVEDNSDDIELINRALKENRLVLTWAVTGRAAKKCLREHGYDLCLLDLNLPDMDGIEVVRWAKKECLNVPFFVLTGIGAHDGRISQVLDAGAECVIQKPLSADNARMISSLRR